MPLIDVEKSILLVIDAQENFYREHRNDVDRDRLSAVFDRVAWVVAVARESAVPVVVTEEDSSRNGPTDKRIRAEYPTGVTVLPKAVFSAADNPDILAAIEATGASTVVLVGLETDICVAHSALRLQELGKRVVAVHDALFSPNAAHDHGIERLKAAGIEIISAKELLYDWHRTVENIRAFAQSNPALSQPPGFSM